MLQNQYLSKLNFICTIAFVIFTSFAKAQTLGNFPATSVKVGSTSNVSPGAAPTNTVRISVYASKGFSGILTASTSSGKVTIVNAKPVGTYTIYVRAYNSSGANIIRTFNLTVTPGNCSQGEFTGTYQVTGLYPNLNNIAIADFNKDGKQDMAVAHEGFNTISIRLGNGSGNFTGSTEVNVGSHPYYVVVGDFNRDGNQDIANTNLGNDIIVIRLGDGFGGFTSVANSSVGLTPVGLAIGDFNNDGKQDFVTANLNAHTASIRLGDGVGGFTGTTEVSVADYPYSVAVGDFNNDNKQDIATTSGTTNAISIRFGNGLGSFTGTTEVPVGADPYSVAVGDFNHDGNQDLATANYIGNSVSIRLGDGAGNFGGTLDEPVGSNPYSVALGNFNGDNHIDIASANYFSNTVTVRLGDGSGNFNDSSEIVVGSYPVCVAVGEFNNDGLQDLAVGNYQDHNISIRMGVAGIAPTDSVGNNSPICERELLQMNAYGGIKYSWTGPGGFTSANQHIVIPVSSISDSGNYIVTVTDSLNCSAVSSSNVTIYPLPVVTFSLSFDTLYTNDTIQLLSGGSPPGGIYSGQGILPGNYFDPSSNPAGNYLFIYTFTDWIGCSNNDTDKIHLLSTVDIEKANAAISFNVYPNPVKDVFKIDLVDADENCTITIITPEGKLIKEWHESEISKRIFSISNVSDGVYYLEIYLNQRKYLKRIIKIAD